MNRERAKELLPIIQAFAEGKVLQVRGIGGKWKDIDDAVWFPSDTYRIKPELFECWVNVYDDNIAGHLTEEDAIQCCGPAGKTIHMREAE